MAARKTKIEFDAGPKAMEAHKLAVDCFDLMEKLGHSYEKMAKQSGLSVSQLYAIKTKWVNGNNAYRPSYMYPTIANGLVAYWNANLKTVAPKTKRKRKKAKTELPEKSSKLSCCNDDSLMIVKIMIDKIGMLETKELLTAKGKSELWYQYLNSLSPEELVELV